MLDRLIHVDMLRSMKRAVSLSVVLVGMIASTTTEAAYKLGTLSTTDYGVSDQQVGANQSAIAMMSSILLANQLYPPGLISKGTILRDKNVVDWLFIDPETGSPSFGDDVFWDPANQAISYYAGHGSNVIGPQIGCTSSAQCTTPDAGTTMPGKCIAYPSSSYCFYKQAHLIVTNGQVPLATSSNLIDYTDIIFRMARWGESANSGPWAGAGTNGGVNATILDISHGVKPGMWQDWLVPPMAGVHWVGTAMPVSGDTGLVAQRGQSFGDAYLSNPKMSVASSWLTSLALTPRKTGDPCGALDYSQGGGQGMNGCGCLFTISADASDALAVAHLKENWDTIRNDSLDAIGNNNVVWKANCNYDANATPFLR
ncbi:hypothetical protein BH09MYX1_BH09MYX1_01090 [soil metagenome]